MRPWYISVWTNCSCAAIGYASTIRYSATLHLTATVFFLLELQNYSHKHQWERYLHKLFTELQNVRNTGTLTFLFNWSVQIIYPLKPHDASKHHFTYLKTGLTFLQLRVLERKFSWNWFPNTWHFSLIFKPRPQFSTCSGWRWQW